MSFAAKVRRTIDRAINTGRQGARLSRRAPCRPTRGSAVLERRGLISVLARLPQHLRCSSVGLRGHDDLVPGAAPVSLRRRAEALLDSRRGRGRGGLLRRGVFDHDQRSRYSRPALASGYARLSADESVLTLYNRPARTTPQSSQTPRAPERRKPIKERKLTPKTNGPCFAKMPIRLEPIKPPTTTSATTSRLNATSTLRMNSSSPLWTKPTSIWPSRISSRKSCSWYGIAAATRASSVESFWARARIRPGEKRSSIRLRAYGFATSKTLKSG